MPPPLSLTDPVVPMHHPRLLIETARGEGAEREALLEATGIDAATLASPDARISYTQFGLLTINAMRLTGDPSLGQKLGRRVGVSHLGVLGLAMMSSPDVGAAIDTGLRYYRILAPGWDLGLHVDDRWARFVARPVLPFGPLQVFATEALLFALEGQMEFLMGERMPIEAVYLPYARPDHADRYDSLDESLLHYDAPRVEVVFDRDVLSRPLAYADPLTVQLALRRCEEQLDAFTANEDLIGRARRALAANPGKFAELHALAAHLGIEMRQLRRELRAANTSYQALRDEVRREQALAQVISTRLSSEEVGRWLGFCDGRSFRRAFQRWTGCTLSEYRARHAG